MGPMRARVVVLSALLAAAVAAIAAVFALGLVGSDTPTLKATPYPEPLQSPITTGRDNTGASVTVPQEGRPAVVTFLFASCPTVCPMVATQLAAALDQLPASTVEAVDVVAITVDPTGDSPAAVTKFLERHRLTGRMRYIVGNRQEVAPMWQQWGVEAQPTGNAQTSLHTARVVLIDRRQRQLGSYPGGLPIPPADLAADIQALVDSD